MPVARAVLPSRLSPLSRAYVARLKKAGVENLSESHLEVVGRLEAALLEVRAERAAAGRSFLAVARGGGR